ncbi:MAG: flavodoxin family protein [Dehalobacterium sp.]
MKVVAFNGSPKKAGNTASALKMIAEELEKNDIEVEIVHVGGKKIRGCISCYKCVQNKDEKCVIDDEVNEWIQKMKTADGIIFASPVYFSGISGTMKCFLDRALYVASVANNRMLRYKVGVSFVAVRRSGGVTAFNALNQYISLSEMVMPTSNYWNVIYGGTVPGEAENDVEGKQIARILGKNMAWLIKVIDTGKKIHGMPELEPKQRMNFIR